MAAVTLSNFSDRPTETFSLILFGATGDLSRGKIWPAIYNLFRHNLLPQDLYIIASGRTEYTSQEFSDYLARIWQEHYGEVYDASLAASIITKCHYFAGDLTDKSLYQRIKDWLAKTKLSGKTCHNRVFHLAILPSLYQTVVENLGQAGLSNADCGFVRLMIEKPFGQDLASAQALDQSLKLNFSENQIYRIDHYLAKETVQNIWAFRFANELFEPQLNNRYIDHIQISFLEEIGIKDRGKFYEQTGVLRDVVQNHLLQVLAVATMDEPGSDSPEDFRRSRQNLLKALMPPKITDVVAGQYQTYRQEKYVNPESNASTFLALKTEIQTSRWQGVPIYLRAGKKLARTATDVMMVFRDNSRIPSSNVLNFRLAPDESIVLRFFIKKPGHTNELQPAHLQFKYSGLKSNLMLAYERVLLDAYSGNQLLFTLADEIESEWRFVAPIIEHLNKGSLMPNFYPDNSWGPEDANGLIKKDSRTWLAPSVDLVELNPGNLALR